MVPDKLSWFRRLLSKIGKRFLWSRQPKESGLMFTLTYLEDVKLMMEMTDGTLETALAEFHKLGKLAGHDLTYEFLDIGKYVFSKSLEDLAIIIETSYYVMTGQRFSSCKYLPPDDGNPARVIFTLDRCMFCGSLKEDKSIEVNKETMGNQTWGSVMAGAVEAAVETIEEYVGNKLKVEVRETKCIMAGDLYAEFTIYLYPEES
ncbi:MAG: hypothetical protein ACFFDN_07730 [Candidatus Hodarchaeota archaeon]